MCDPDPQTFRKHVCHRMAPHDTAALILKRRIVCAISAKVLSVGRVVIQSRRQRALTQGRRKIAGRPRQEAERVTGLEEQARSVEIGMFKEMTKRYRERPADGPLCTAWNDAVDAATLTRLAMQKLGDMLRRKAQIADPGPCGQLLTAKGEPCEPTPEGWNLASACVELVRRRAQVNCDPDGRTGATVEPQGMG